MRKQIKRKPGRPVKGPRDAPIEQVILQAIHDLHHRIGHEALIVAAALDLINERIDSLPARIDTIGKLNLSAEQRAALHTLLANGHDT